MSVGELTSRLDESAVVVLTATSDSDRRAGLQDLLAKAAGEPSRVWAVSCDFESGGPWAGTACLLGALIEEMRAVDPELIQRHDYELVRVLPGLKESLGIRYATLTDTAPAAEKVRNYPADRAYRIVNGLVDLLLEYKGRFADERWIVGCDAFDQAGQIDHRFFRELGRRLAARRDLSLVMVVSPAAGCKTCEALGLPADRALALDLPGAPAALDRAAAERRAQELEAIVDRNKLRAEIHVPALIDAWRRAGNEERLFLWQRQALEIYNGLGLYEDALVYGQAVWSAIDRFAGADPDVRWGAFGKIFACHIALQDAASALELAESMLNGDGNPDHRSQVLYLLAMLHTRFLADRDLDRAEAYLDEALLELGKADLTPEEHWFRYVFNRNGLALVCHLAGRPQEAIELCRTGIQLLEEHLDPEHHRLHRSVLIYNIAQVLAATGALDPAVESFSAAIALDPNYSEYYNERGNLFLKMNRLESAREDYLKAIELSPPYPEVFANLGQCCRLAGQAKPAIDAYSKALELQPRQVLSLLGRAQAFEMSGRHPEAIQDYSAALLLQPDQWEALANRACLHFELGDFEQALGDIDRAIALAPRIGELYQSRAVALEAVGRHAESRLDLAKFEEMTAHAAS